MKKYILKILVQGIVFAAFLSLSGCKWLSELTALSKCEFRLQSVEHVRVSGVNLENKNDFSDINMLDVAKITKNFATKNCPLELTFNIESRNPGTAKAAIRKFEWIAMIDNIQIASSTVNQKIEILPGKHQTIPVNLSCNLRSIFSKESMKSLVNLGLNIVQAGNEPSRLSIKIKPTIYIEATDYAYPGYITLSKEFKTK